MNSYYLPAFFYLDVAYFVLLLTVLDQLLCCEINTGRCCVQIPLPARDESKYPGQIVCISNMRLRTVGLFLNCN